MSLFHLFLQFGKGFSLEVGTDGFLTHAVVGCEVDAQHLGDVGSKLLRIEGTVVSGFAQRFHAFAEGHHPRLLRTLRAGTMV